MVVIGDSDRKGTLRVQGKAASAHLCEWPVHTLCVTDQYYANNARTSLTSSAAIGVGLYCIIVHVPLSFLCSGIHPEPAGPFATTPLMTTTRITEYLFSEQTCLVVRRSLVTGPDHWQWDRPRPRIDVATLVYDRLCSTLSTLLSKKNLCRTSPLSSYPVRLFLRRLER